MMRGSLVLSIVAVALVAVSRITAKSVPGEQPAAVADGVDGAAQPVVPPAQTQSDKKTAGTKSRPAHRTGSGKVGQEAWGYVTVRPGAHMFYWLYYTTHADGYHTRPLVIWFQGGPGASGCGYGNFEEIGPLDVNLVERNTTWIKEANVLFVDHPVGTGYSYVEDPSLFTTDIQQITDDLIVFITEFMDSYTPFKTIPIFIFGQSYGGKMGSHFAVQLWKDIQAGTIDATLTGFAMGNSWISPELLTMSWGSLCYHMSLVDDQGYAAIQRSAEACQLAIHEGRWQDATDLWAATEVVVIIRTHYVDFYNILKFNLPEPVGNGTFSAVKAPYRPAASPKAADPLDELMNGPIKEYLGIIPANVTWGGQSDDVFTYQEVDFMKPVISSVDEALMTTDLQVVVYQGQLDLICDTYGAMDWVQQLTWPDLANYNNASRQWFIDNDLYQTDMFVKAYNKFKFYWLLDAGHSVPKDNGNTAYRMLQRILGNMDV